MKHITPTRLDELSELLDALRELEGLVEKRRGIFHRKSRAFLHFHEDPAGLFCDVRLQEPDFERFRVSTRSEQRSLLRAVDAALAPA